VSQEAERIHICMALEYATTGEAPNTCAFATQKGASVLVARVMLNSSFEVFQLKMGWGLPPIAFLLLLLADVIVTGRLGIAMVIVT
jgi:hypothetical protein